MLLLIEYTRSKTSINRCFHWFYPLAIVLLLEMFTSCVPDKKSIRIENPIQEAPVLFAIEEINKALTANNLENKNIIIHTQLSENIDPEGYKITVSNNKVTISGGDAVGLMYGLLDVAEKLKTNQEITETVQSPRFEFRAIKFNLPWDSYRNGPALQLHYETCRDTVFWEAFLSMMARNRFNKLTLWNLHPFNYLVKTEKYPEACGFSDEEMIEWETFWKSLFRMAKDRGIETYLVNWNIFVSPEFAKAHNVAEYCIRGDYYIDKGDTSEIIKDYTREAVREVIDKYPNLTGLGITLGEGMGGMTANEREVWLLESFIEGMRKASRKIKFIHRVPLSAGTGSGGSTNSYVERMTRQTLDTLSSAISPVNIELKFNWSHAHSCPELVKVHGGKLTDAYWNPMPENYRLAWMMRNEDFFVLRWGQPDFIREHISLNGKKWVNGYFVGSETYIPAKDYITALPNTSNGYAFDRQWMFYKCWGRLLYNPNTPDAVFISEFESRFPGYGDKLFNAQLKVSNVPLIIASYWNATWDYTLYSEGLLSIMGHDSMKLISLKEICDKQPMAPDYVSVKQFIHGSKEKMVGCITPVNLADSLEVLCSNALELIGDIDSGDNADLTYEVSDIVAWARLGMYFSNKLRAAIAYQQYHDFNEKTYVHQAYRYMEKATYQWEQLVKTTSEVYKPMPLQHYEVNDHKPFHWSVVQKEVEAELAWLQTQLY